MLMILINDDFTVDIDLQFGELNPIMQWCQRNCQADWCYQVIADAGENAGSYKFSFENNTDLINFILWKK